MGKVMLTHASWRLDSHECYHFKELRYLTMMQSWEL